MLNDYFPRKNVPQKVILLRVLTSDFFISCCMSLVEQTKLYLLLIHTHSNEFLCWENSTLLWKFCDISITTHSNGLEYFKKWFPGKKSLVGNDGHDLYHIPVIISHFCPVPHELGYLPLKYMIDCHVSWCCRGNSQLGCENFTGKVTRFLSYSVFVFAHIQTILMIVSTLSVGVVMGLPNC